MGSVDLNGVYSLSMCNGKSWDGGQGSGASVEKEHNVIDVFFFSFVCKFYLFFISGG